MTERRTERDLTREECIELLGMASMGRVALSIDALPVVLPVGFALLDDDVVFRPLLDTKLSQPGVRVVLAFQVDHFDPLVQTGWNILVQGLASEITDPSEIARCRELMPAIGAPSKTIRFARIATTRLTGQQIASRAS